MLAAQFRHQSDDLPPVKPGPLPDFLIGEAGFVAAGAFLQRVQQLGFGRFPVRTA